MKKNTRKLAVNKETIRSLAATDLTMRGGNFPQTITACMEGECVPPQTTNCGTHGCTQDDLCGSGFNC